MKEIFWIGCGSLCSIRRVACWDALGGTLFGAFGQFSTSVRKSSTIARNRGREKLPSNDLANRGHLMYQNLAAWSLVGKYMPSLIKNVVRASRNAQFMQKGVIEKKQKSKIKILKTSTIKS